MERAFFLVEGPESHHVILGKLVPCLDFSLPYRTRTLQFTQSKHYNLDVLAHWRDHLAISGDHYFFSKPGTIRTAFQTTWGNKAVALTDEWLCLALYFVIVGDKGGGNYLASVSLMMIGKERQLL